MTARTLRDSSPAVVGPAGRQSEIIAVPPIPDAYMTTPSSRQRTVSLQSPGTAASPPAKASAARNSSLDRSPEQWPAEHPEATEVTDPAELERHGSRGSINFSYPMNARPNYPRQRSSSEGHRPDNDSSYGSSQASPPPIQPTNQGSRAGQDQRTQARADSHVQHTTSGHRSASDTHGRSGLRGQHSHASEPVRPGKHSAHSSTDGDVEIRQKPSGSQANNDVDQSRREVARGSIDTHDLRVPKKKPSTVHESAEEHGEDHYMSSQSHHSGTEDDTKAVVNGKAPSAPLPKAHEETSPKSAQLDRQHGRSPPAPPKREQPATTTTEQRTQQDSSGATAPRTAHVPYTTASQSPSPTRATRFSDHLEVANQSCHLHEPPPSSKTPGKPALKRSTSQSRSPDRAIHNNKAMGVSSEMSESTSAASDEAFTTKQEKKTPKVSFDDEAGTHVSTVSPRASSSSPEPSSPQSSLPYGGRNRRTGKDEADSFDDILKPRPTLPSFGSIRGRRPFVDEKPDIYPDKAEADSRAATETPSSNDHALGAVLRDSTSNRTVANAQPEFNLPLPPVVTSVEGSGYEYSSEESSDSDDVDDFGSFVPPGRPMYSPPLRSGTAQENEGVHRAEEKTRHRPATDDNQQLHSDEVPTISVQPATPHLEEPDLIAEGSEIPGRFAPEDHGSATSSENTAQSEADTVRPTQSSMPPRGTVMEDDSSTSSQANATQLGLAIDDDSNSSSDSGDSVYSDAAEDLSELDGDGFGSINAIVDSPVSKTPRSARYSISDSPTALKQEAVVGTRAVEGDGPLATSSGVRSSSLASESSPVIETQMRSAQGTENEPDGAFPVHYQSLPLRTTEHSAPIVQNPAVNTKLTSKPTSSSNPQGQQEACLADQTPRPNEQVSTAPQQPRKEQNYQEHQKSVSVPADQAVAGPLAPAAFPKETGVNGPGRRVNGEAEPPTRPQMERTLSNGSDSSSSFKRMRRSPPATGRHSLRPTLRDGQRNLGATSPSSEISAASANQRRPFSSDAGPSGMRTTLREPPDGKVKKTSIFSGAMNPTKSKPLPKRNLFSSSSQKTEAKERGRFRSRFDDSSDDDEYEMTDIRPVRGIPRRRDEVDGDSTELEDSSDDVSQQKAVKKDRSRGTRSSAAGTPALAAALADARNTQPGPSANNPAEFLREQRKQRSGLLSRLNPSKRKHRGEEVGIRKSDLESEARRDTPLERSKLALERARVTPANPAATGTTATATADRPQMKSQISSKLQKRVSRFGSGSGQLQSNNVSSAVPPSIPEGGQQTPPPDRGRDADRPHTSDGVVAHGSPNNAGDSPRSKRFLSKLQMHNRQRTTDTSIPRSPLSDSGLTGWGVSGGKAALKGEEKKKSRFPMLKKALGIRR